MTTPFDQPMLSPWEAEGRRQAEALNGCAFVLVFGEDPRTAAELALGMGREHARRRRVAVVDAVGELDVIEDLSPMDAPHNVIDVFVHGVSLAFVAHQVDSVGNLHVLPSGPTPLDYESLFTSDRWESLAREFREAESLLLVVAPAGHPALDPLLPLVDGVVLVGRVRPVPGVRALAHAGAPASGPHPALPPNIPRPTPGSVPRTTRTSGPRRAGGRRRTPPRMLIQQPGRPWAGWITGILASLLAGGLWFSAHRSGTRAAEPSATPAVGKGADSATASGGAGGATAAAPLTAAVADSEAAAAAWSVELWAASSTTAANVTLEQEALRGLDALTYAPTDDSAGEREFRVSAGAFRDRAEADSLLARLRARKVLGPSDGRVVRRPYAVVVQSGVTRDEASFYGSGLRAKGLPVYALIQDDGTARLYAGAYERRQDAELLVSMFTANGEMASVTYRTGRAP